MRRIKLVKIGSDPELVFATMAEWQHTLVPATEVITANKALGLTTFIGVDGHASTAELRPPPSHNVYRHVYDIAAGITAMDAYLRRVKKHKDRKVAMFASPYVAKEPLGGHIHVSCLVEDEDMKRIQDLNYVYNSFQGGWQTWDKNRQVANLTMAQQQSMESIVARVMASETMSPTVFATVLNYLLRPFESWVQLWPLRIARNQKYGGNGADQVRIALSQRPSSAIYRNWAYQHYEYRVPSTPLMHPVVTYAYLALVKLAMTNFRKLTDYALEHPATEIKSTEPQNSKCFQQFKDRWAMLDKLGLRYSADTKNLREATEAIAKNREDWFNPYKPIDTRAWAKWTGV